MSAAGNRQELRDLWTDSPEYRQLFQSADEVEAVVHLLELETATALLDVGCGNGTFAVAAARANAACRVWAFDALPSAAAACRDRAAREIGDGRFVAGVAVAEQVPLADGSVDRVLCRAVLHHLARPRVAYAEIARVLRPDGLLLLQAPCNYWQAGWGEIISDLYRFDDDSHRRTYHEPAAVVADLNAVGLAMRSAHCWPYPATNLKPEAVAFIKQHDAERRFQLKQESDGTWACRLYWLRVLAVRI